jgi:putative nucleotidyltransferase with HDIG domain
VHQLGALFCLQKYTDGVYWYHNFKGTNMNKVDKAMRLVAQLGKDSYIVGGAVRDIVMDLEPNDIDIATARTIESIVESDLHTFDIGQSQDFGIVGVSFQDEVYEVAQFRKDGDYSDSRRPDTVDHNATMKDDAERRDFTINAMYMDADGQIIDLHKGQRDIQKKMIRAVGDPNKRFEEDALRIIRAHRFAAKFGFKIEARTKAAIIKNIHGLQNIAIERISQELIKVAGYGGKAMAKFIDDMIKTDVIRYVLPEIVDATMFDQHYLHHPEGAMVFDRETEKYIPYSIKKHGKEPSKRYVIDNGSVYDHIIAALKTYKGNDPLVTLGILFHDIGKPISAELHPKRDSYKFIGHDKTGVELFAKIAERLKFSSKMTESITFCIQHHMRFHAIPRKATKILPIRQSPHYETLAQVAFSDDSCRGEAFDANHLKAVFDEIEKIYRTFGQKEAFDKKMKGFVNGKVVMDTRPELEGSDIGKVVIAAKEFVIEREFKVTKKDVIEFIEAFEVN